MMPDAWCHSCRGGYTSFSFDISAQMLNRTTAHELVVSVYDPSEYGMANLLGKQRSDVSHNFHGMPVL